MIAHIETAKLDTNHTHTHTPKVKQKLQLEMRTQVSDKVASTQTNHFYK